MEEVKWAAPEFIEFEGRLYESGFCGAGGLAEPAQHAVKRLDIRCVLAYPSYFYVETPYRQFAVSKEQRDRIVEQLLQVVPVVQ